MSERDDHDGGLPDVPAGALTRRELLVASASGAMAALLPGCNGAPQEHIVPYVDRPPELTPGISRYYATAALRRGVAIGVLAESRDGRPIKIEGNPDHPFSLGATGPTEQALARTLYDLDRLDAIDARGGPASFAELARAFGPSAQRKYVRERGEGLHLWLSPTTSPLVEHLLGRIWERYPRAEVWFDPAAVPLTSWAASQRVFGRVLAPQYDFTRADRVLALDASFLIDEPGSIRWARDWSARRAPEGEAPMSRCYVVDSAPSGASAAFDHRLTVRPSEVGLVAAAILASLGEGVPSGPRDALSSALDRAPHAEWIRAVARDLDAHRGRAIVVASEQQPAHVQVLALLLNAALDAYGSTIRLTRAPWVRAGEDRFRPAPLFDALEAGSVDALFCLGGDPAYTARATHRFDAHAPKASDVVVLSEFPTATTRFGTWVIPELHLLERWGDARAWDGTWTPIQPLIRPIFGGHQLEEVLLALLGEQDLPIHRLLSDRLRDAGFDLPDVLARGLVPSSALADESVSPTWDALGPALDELARGPGDGLELVLRRSLLDEGSQWENPWLHELPDVVTRVSWDNVAQLAPEDAARLGLEQGDVVELTTAHGSARLPIAAVHTQAPGTIVAALGYGRSAGGRTARDVGVDVSSLRGAPDQWTLAVRARATGEHRSLAMFHPHHELPDTEEVSIILRRSLDAFERHPEFAERYDEPPPSLYPERQIGSPQWGMAIDLNRCIGCEACVIACQAENNLPVVGKVQVERGRAMHWLRIDAYLHRGQEPIRGEDERRWTLQPMLCQHCEKAPCEYVCPVNATVHSPDGLNEMVYNRCVGTRFCSNNCPYKIRRFNWYDWHRTAQEPETMVFNPDVTVRGRGVMEKCTYCVQRIRRAQIRARAEGSELADGDVVTACQEACPTGVFAFGDVSDPESNVSRWYARDRIYAVLHELGTRPRTRYLARIDNVNRELAGE